MNRHDDEYYRQRKPQPDLGLIQNFKRFLWDPRRRAFLDRTCHEWTSVGLFYLCFYSVLFSLFTFQMWLTYKYVVAHDKPYFSYTDKIEAKAWLDPELRSLFGVMMGLNLRGPGIVVKPSLIPNIHPPLILLDETHETGKREKYIDAIKELLVDYRVNRTNYDSECKEPREEGMAPCFFDLHDLGPCARTPFGYDEDDPMPCVYIKFNRRFNWFPIIYQPESYLPRDMPIWLETAIQGSNEFQIWLTCEGKSRDDRRNMGMIEYLPGPGFPAQFFPFLGQPGYLSPMVAIRFRNLTVNQVVTIECKTWARNIDNINRYHLIFRILISEKDL